MAFTRPTLTELINRVCTNINTYVEHANAFVKQSVFNVLAKIIGALHLDLYVYLDEMAKNFFITTADINGLMARGSDIGVFRKKASFATGNIIVTGTAGTNIPLGTTYSTISEQQYKTTADAVVGINGTVTVPVQATSTGVAGNQDAGAEFTLVNPIVGLLSSATADSNGITGGAETEETESYRARLLLALRNSPGAGDTVYYENAALSQPGVTRAKAYRTYAGAGTVGVTFLMENTYDDGIPRSGDVAAMKEYLESIMPADLNEIIVFAPTPTVIDITINNLTPDTTQLRDAINNSLVTLFHGYDFGETVYRGQIETAIGAVPGEISHILAAPVADTTIPVNGIAVLGTITYGVTE